jgi:hypothetical protein
MNFQTTTYEPTRTETVVEHRATNSNSWIAALAVVIVILTMIVLGNLIAGTDGETQPTGVTVDVTTDAGS